MKLLTCFWLAFLSVAVWAAPLAQKCGQPAGKKWRYCIYSSGDSQRADDFLYYLHRAGESETFYWLNVGAALDSIWESSKSAPTVISISYGQGWLLTEPNSLPASGLLKDFVEDVIPTVEQNVIGRSPKQRMLLGESMGGFNATELILRHPDLFSKAALMCPGYIDFNPYASAPVIDDYVKRTGADLDALGALLQLIQSFYPDAPAWDAESPLLTADKYLSKATPAIFIADGKDDYFGFYPGAMQFADLARQHGVHVQVEDKMKGHCENMDSSEMTKNLARFLEP